MLINLRMEGGCEEGVWGWGGGCRGVGGRCGAVGLMEVLVEVSGSR